MGEVMQLGFHFLDGTLTTIIGTLELLSVDGPPLPPAAPPPTALI